MQLFGGIKLNKRGGTMAKLMKKELVATRSS
jgi:hypothetical protein